MGERSADRAITIDQQRVIEAVSTILRDTNTPGASVALAQDAGSLFAAGVGFTDLACSSPMPADAQFYLYSITKVFLATVALQLAGQGLLTLDTPAQAHLPTLPLATPVTLRQLLSHTAGIPDYGPMPAYAEAVRSSPSHPWTTDDFLAHTLPRGLTFPPGQGWAYSNIGFLIIRLVLERITGLSLRDLLHQRIFAPLDLRRTFVAETLTDASVLTPGYSAFFRPDDAFEDISTIYHPGWVSHGVVISTAAELARLIHTLFSAELLPAESLATMLIPHPVPGSQPGFHEAAYGLGVMVDRQSPYGVLSGHGGGGPGYSAAAFSFSNVAGQRVTTVALVNHDQPPQATPIAFALAHALT
ncbi:MAG: serine hydrolase domain-containing protein [Ktedonobacterales bacterium]